MTKILFVLRKARTNEAGLCPVYCRVTVNGVRGRQFSTGVNCSTDKWDYDRNRIRGTDNKTRSENAKLDLIYSELTKISVSLEMELGEFTLNLLIDKYLGINEQKAPTFTEVFSEYLKTIEAKLDTGEIVKATYTKWGTWLVNWKRVCEFEPRFDTFEKLSFDDFDKIRHYFIVKRQFSHNYTAKMLQGFKAVLTFAVQKKYTTHNVWLGLKSPKSKRPSIVYLTPEELLVLEEFTFAGAPLQKACDYFVFCCYTGLSYADFSSLTDASIIQDKGREWIVLQRQKGRGKYGETILPLLKTPKRLIEKYGGVTKLPKMTNQRLNLYLKEVMLLTGIKTHLTCHTARRTFAMKALNEWAIPIESVSKMIGHSDIKTTQKYYATVNISRLANDMKDVE